jgi:aspartate dehydrogenase
MPLKLGLIGAGAIGGAVIDMLRNDPALEIEVPAVLVRTPRPDDLSPLHTTDADRFFAERFDAVLEGAGHQAVRDHGERVLASGADLIATSVGAFTDDALLQQLVSQARSAGSRLIIPSAGIGALDILSGAAMGGLDRVQMIVRKDPNAWYGTAAEGEFDLAAVVEPTVIFEGSARAGAAKYPQNVNISAAVSLAGIGLDKTELVIYADPTIDTHVIEVIAEGAFGRFNFVEDVAVSPENRKTGRIVAMSVLKTVRQLASPLVIGA